MQKNSFSWGFDKSPFSKGPAKFFIRVQTKQEKIDLKHPIDFLSFARNYPALLKDFLIWLNVLPRSEKIQAIELLLYNYIYFIDFIRSFPQYFEVLLADDLVKDCLIRDAAALAALREAFPEKSAMLTAQFFSYFFKRDFSEKLKNIKEITFNFVCIVKGWGTICPEIYKKKFFEAILEEPYFSRLFSNTGSFVKGLLIFPEYKALWFEKLLENRILFQYRFHILNLCKVLLNFDSKGPHDCLRLLKAFLGHRDICNYISINFIEDFCQHLPAYRRFILDYILLEAPERWIDGLLNYRDSDHLALNTLAKLLPQHTFLQNLVLSYPHLSFRTRNENQEVLNALIEYAGVENVQRALFQFSKKARPMIPVQVIDLVSQFTWNKKSTVMTNKDLYLCNSNLQDIYRKVSKVSFFSVQQKEIQSEKEHDIKKRNNEYRLS